MIDVANEFVEAKTLYYITLYYNIMSLVEDSEHRSRIFVRFTDIDLRRRSVAVKSRSDNRFNWFKLI